MSQQMNVLCCYSCEMFQVHIVKKAKKWQCKVCNEKQSFRKIYFEGSGKDCRMHVQELNSRKQNNPSFEHATSKTENRTEYRSNDNAQATWLYNSQDTEMLKNSELSSEGEDCNDIHEGKRVTYQYNEVYSQFKRKIINDMSNDFERNLDSNFNDKNQVNDVNNIVLTQNVDLKEPNYQTNEKNLIPNETENIVLKDHNIFESNEDFDVSLDF